MARNFGKFNEKDNYILNFAKKLDYDNDGVPNYTDCKPKNKRKHSIIVPFFGGLAGSYIGSALYERAKRRRKR